MKRTPLVRRTPLKAYTQLRARMPLPRVPGKLWRPKVTPAERECRRIVATRSGGMCERCASPGTNMHHRRKPGRVWAPSNVLHLCGSGTTGCHGHIESYPAESYRMGWSVPAYANPLTAPVWIFGWGFVYLNDHGEITEVLEQESF